MSVNELLNNSYMSLEIPINNSHGVAGMCEDEDAL